MQYATISFVMSLRLHGTTQLPYEEISLNLILEDFPIFFLIFQV
jgi:hypothetical protein